MMRDDELGIYFKRNVYKLFILMRHIKEDVKKVVKMNKKAEVTVKVAGILFLFAIVLVLSFVIADHSISVAGGGTSFSFNESDNNLYNISVNNTDAGQASNITSVTISIPATFSFVSSSNGTSVAVSNFTNTSTVLTWVNSTEYLINGSEVQYFWFNATASTPGNYNITVSTTNVTGTYYSNLSVEINDTTAPVMTFVEPSNNSSLSQTYIFINLTAVDLNNGIDNISLRLYNSSEIQINYTSNDTSPVTMNVTGLAEGVYYINATSNDTLGNEDSTSTILFRLDTTNPEVNFSCDDTDVEVDDTITCSCNASDSLSGVATLSYDSSPPTSSAGDFTVTCTATDYAGNSNVSSIDYEVDSGYTSSGSGPTTTTYWKNTYIPSELEFVKGYYKELAVKSRIRVTINGSQHSVGVVYLTSTTATINVSSDPQQVFLSVGDEEMFEVNDDDYYDIYVKLNSIESDKANITVKYVHDLIASITNEDNLSLGLNDTGNNTGNNTGNGTLNNGYTGGLSSRGSKVLFWILFALGTLVFIGVAGATFYYFYFVVYKESKAKNRKKTGPSKVFYEL